MIYKKRGSILFLSVQILIYALAFLFVFYRLQRGIDFTDESWYVSDPYLVSQGYVFPYLSNWTQAPGFTIPLAVAYNVFASFSGTEGVFLFSRILFLIWVYLIGVVSVWIVYKRINKEIPILWYLPFVLSMPCLFDINYNTIGLFYLPLIIVLVISGWNEDNKKAFFFGLAGGIIGGRAIMGTIQIFLACLFIFLVSIHKKKWGITLGLFSGVLLSLAVVIGCCLTQGGSSAFLRGLRIWITENGYARTPPRHTIQLDLAKFGFFLLPLFAFAVIALIFRVAFRSNEKSFSVALTALILLFFTIGFFKSFRETREPTSMIKWCWFESYALLLLKEKKKGLSILLITVTAFLLTFLVSSFCNIYGFGSREYWLIPAVVMTCAAIFLLFRKPFASKTVFILMILCLFFIQAKASWNFSYRDEPIGMLDTKVTSGAWAGCYTTKQRAADVAELEAVLRIRTDDNDRVFFQDWVSFGYLISNGKPCTHSSLRGSGYTYQVNDPYLNYVFFLNEGTVPTKIFYIDFGRDKQLSIEDPAWQFNTFVYNFYTEVYSFQNMSFRLLEFDLNNECGAKEFVQAHVR